MLRFNLLGVAITSAIVLRNSLRIVSQYASPSPSKHSQPLVADLFRKQARPLLSTASLSLAALWRFGAVPLLEALTLRGASTPWRFAALWRFLTLWQHSGDEHRRRRLRLRACGFAALRLCGFAASAIHGGGNAAAMNAGGGAWVAELAARRLCGLRVPWRLCGFDAFEGARVYPNPRAIENLASQLMWYFPLKPANIC